MRPTRHDLLPGCLLCAALLAGATAACVPAKKPEASPVVVAIKPPSKADYWKRVASAGDIDRIARLPSAWSTALGEARTRGAREEVRKEGRLLDPTAALARPTPTPGSYSCRMIRLGSADEKAPAFERFKPFFCYVQEDGELLTIIKQTGSQRPAGRLWEDDDPTRLVYLGSLALGEEDGPKAYGEDPKRDMAGVLQRIAPFVWRLVIPWPRGNSRLDVYELTPVAEQPK
ncbi:MAG: DUF4893 domain-containing protein [Sphingomicrobium sp.]|nr:DUF4893 domain-containing protein [Sphingomonadales bacterium]